MLFYLSVNSLYPGSWSIDQKKSLATKETKYISYFHFNSYLNNEGKKSTSQSHAGVLKIAFL